MKVLCFLAQTLLKKGLHHQRCFLFLFFLTSAVLSTQPTAAQYAPLQFTPIPYSEPDIVSPGRGAEQWENGSESINSPMADSNQRSLDVYCRFPWTRLEDTIAGKFNWSYFDEIIQDAIDNGQKLSFGIMPVYDGEGTMFYDSAKSAYPLYLHKAMQASVPNSRDWISHGVWIPNWNHPYYLLRLRALHTAINAHILRSSYKGVPYKNAIYCIDIRGYGNYGEWHNAGIVENINQYPNGRRATVATLKAIIDHHTQVFTQWPLTLMIAAFDAEQYDAIMNPAELAHYALTTRNDWGPLGWRRDQWGATDPYLDKLLKNNEKKFGSSPPFKDLITTRYLSAPITGEPPRYISPGGPCDYWDLEQQLVDYGATSVGNGNWGKKLIGCGQDNARAAFKRAGYRIILEGGSISNVITPGKPFLLKLDWKNVGIAPTYEEWNVFFDLKNEGGQLVWSTPSAFKPKLFAPSQYATEVTENFSLPADILPGRYRLDLVIKDPNGYRAPLPLAIQGRNSDGSYTLQELNISPVTCMPPTASVSVSSVCNQPAILVLDSATGTGPYSLVVNGTSYEGVSAGQQITTVSAPLETIWSAAPEAGSFIDSPVELGLKFKATAPGTLKGIRFFSSDGASGIYTGHLWTESGILLDSVLFTNVSPVAWQEASFATPFKIQPHTTYIVSYHTSSGHYASTSGGLKEAVSNGSLFVEGESTSGGNGVYMYGPSGSFPVHSFNAANYWVDVVFSPDSLNYSLTGISDANGCSNSGILQNIPIIFNNNCDSLPADSIPPPADLAAVLVNTAACKGEPFQIILDSANGTAPYTLVINGVTYTNISPGETITTVGPPAQNVWNDDPNPSGFIDSPVELGMKFRTTVAGSIKGIRFFSSNEPSGIYTGHLWNASGELLDSVVFTNVKPNSWQEALFNSPVVVSPNNTYIVSYHTTGYYASTAGGLKNTITNGSLVVPGDSVAGGNGLYMYGPSGSFPVYSYNAANYWADVVFAPDAGASLTFELTSILDQVGKQRHGSLQTLTVVPATCDSVPGDSQPTATIGYSADCGTQTLSLVLDSANGTAPYDLVINGVVYRDVMPGETITTIGAPSQSIWNGQQAVVSAEDQPVELGVKFKSAIDGHINGIRFYSPANASGIYTGHLWTKSGVLLGSVTFSNVTASGWQEALFNAPVSITADSVYIASYHTSSGHYAATTGGLKHTITNSQLTALGDSIAGGNGVYRYGAPGSFPDMTYNANNYWVDVLFASDETFTYTFDLTSITDQAGFTKTGTLQTLSISPLVCQQNQPSAESTSISQKLAGRASAIDNIDTKAAGYGLEQNFPNPMSNYTMIKYRLPKPAMVSLALYDINGRIIKILVNGWKEKGNYTVQVDKGLLDAGLYFYRLQTQDFSATKKLVIQ